jgi:hypothetical protein
LSDLFLVLAVLVLAMSLRWLKHRVAHGALRSSNLPGPRIASGSAPKDIARPDFIVPPTFSKPNLVALPKKSDCSAIAFATPVFICLVATIVIEETASCVKGAGASAATMHCEWRTSQRMRVFRR